MFKKPFIIRNQHSKQNRMKAFWIKGKHTFLEETLLRINIRQKQGSAVNLNYMTNNWFSKI